MDERQIVLCENEYMIIEFKEWVNKNFKKHVNLGRKDGMNQKTHFSSQDIYSYIKRGYLPKHMGSYYLTTEIKNGIKIIKVTN